MPTIAYHPDLEMAMEKRALSVSGPMDLELPAAARMESRAERVDMRLW